MRRFIAMLALAGLSTALATGVILAQRKGSGILKKGPPTFFEKEVEKVFFKDVLRAHGKGEGVTLESVGGGTSEKTRIKIVDLIGRKNFGWADVISADALESEIKSSINLVGRHVSSKSQWNKGHRKVRVIYTVLALSFGVIAQYDGEVRFKKEAATLRDLLARSAANSKALELAGITRQSADPEGGHLKKDENGELTGEFVERAPRELLDLIPPLPPMTDYEQSRNLVEGTQLAVASGLTTLHGAGGGTDYEDVQRRLKLYEVGLLRVRINQMVNEEAAKKLGKPLNYDNKFFVQSVKTVLDGALGSRGAHFLEEYSDYPEFRGKPRHSEAVTTQSAIDLLNIGFNMRIHAIGDAANRIALNAFEKALKETGIDGKQARFALEHCQVLTPEDIPRLAELGVIASMQPLHATEDMHFAEARLGPERMEGAYIWGSPVVSGDLIWVGGHGLWTLPRLRKTPETPVERGV